MKSIIFLFVILLAPVLSHAQTKPPADTMTRLKQWIEADQSELSWQQIPWIEAFGPGIVAADKQEKPLLLWVMNGHPLGCT